MHFNSPPVHQTPAQNTLHPISKRFIALSSRFQLLFVANFGIENSSIFFLYHTTTQADFFRFIHFCWEWSWGSKKKSSEGAERVKPCVEWKAKKLLFACWCKTLDDMFCFAFGESERWERAIKSRVATRASISICVLFDINVPYTFTWYSLSFFAARLSTLSADFHLNFAP